MPPKQEKQEEARRGRAAMLALRNMQLSSVSDPAATNPMDWIEAQQNVGIGTSSNVMGMTYTTSNKMPASSYTASEVVK